jgi:hypothetical protein
MVTAESLAAAVHGGLQHCSGREPAAAGAAAAVGPRAAGYRAGECTHECTLTGARAGHNSHCTDRASDCTQI